ncbi:MAG TPA: DUF934 domain-containing protein [Paraburkholderia sp.]|jgi:uncharacterized protein (DUF934 family)|nr:DUF934 domain-containing protein [Paraburkholderia sp.]
MNRFVQIELLTATTLESDDAANVLRLANDDDPLAWQQRLDTIDRIELHFPHFTDGRAYSQAYLLRRRLGFKGDLRATGEVLVDQLIQMQRMGFSSAVLQNPADLDDAQRQLERFAGFYQGDVVQQMRDTRS